MIAAKLGRERAVRILIEHSKKAIEELNPKDNEYENMKESLNCCNQLGPKGNTPLLYAAKKGHLAIVKALVDAGANINAWNTDAETALSLACARGYLDIAKYLIEKGADIHGHDRQRRGPLIRAI